MDLDKFDNFRQGILDTLNDAYDPAARFVGYAEGHDYATSANFVNDSDADADAFATYFPEDH